MNRNEPCWCGSGKKYKHCHLAFDERINGMTFDVFKGQVRPPRKIINNEADIEGIRKAGVVNDGALDLMAAFQRALITRAIRKMSASPLMTWFATGFRRRIPFFGKGTS